MAPRYQAVVAKELRKYGLRYEDLYDPQYDLVSLLALRPQAPGERLLCRWPTRLPAAGPGLVFVQARGAHGSAAAA